ncbi:MAG TPA: PD-(D/E)XK nuclease family protein [Candidatus Sulfotelmatobacter sp.]|nr:PD-(D/E)XK nuclease family protein [Candidatus Sulfotelmatobacter sp.]
MSFRWSFSTDKLFRRCQRQFFFREIAAHHSEKEPWRREAFVLKQLKTLELWRGSVIHEGIQHYVVPALRTGVALDWGLLAEQTIQRAKAQLAFSEQKRYRESGISKTKQEHFCALVPHENGSGVSVGEFEKVCEEIRLAFQRLEAMPELWQPLLGRKDCEAEKQIWVEFDDVKIMVQIDLLFARSLGHPTIIDWKSYEVGGDTDARLQTVLYGWALWKSKLFDDLHSPENIELLECQVQDGILIKHECSLEIFDELEDYLYRSLHRIFSLCRSKKLTEARLQDFAFADNPNNCEHCSFRQLCIERAVLRAPDEVVETLPPPRQTKRNTPLPTLQPAFF